MKIFLTGTDTGVGKTYTAAAIVRQLRAEGDDCVGLKPICCGERDDALALEAANEGVLTLDVVNPVWLTTPVAPYAASLLESRPVDLDLVRKTCKKVLAAHESVIVEGAGGWLVPITRDYFISDLAAELRLPVAVVVANKLGALNHTMLTVRAIAARGLTCAGIILNETQPSSPANTLVTTGNRLMLEALFEVPILGEIEYGAHSVRWHGPFAGRPAHVGK